VRKNEKEKKHLTKQFQGGKPEIPSKTESDEKKGLEEARSKIGGDLGMSRLMGGGLGNGPGHK